MDVFTYTEENFQAYLNSTGFIEEKNEAFGGYVLYTPDKTPFTTYTEENKRDIFYLLCGYMYAKLRVTLQKEL